MNRRPLTGTISTLLLLLWFGATSPVHAQPTDQPVFAEEPTSGVRLPSYGISGEADAFAPATNPAGLQFLAGSSFAIAVDLADEAEVTTAGQGVGTFLGTTLGGGVVPRIGLGLGVEFLTPARIALAPDPGSPTRFTLATSLPLGTKLSIGASWHRYFDDGGQSLDGVTTWDLGVAARFGAYLGAGFVVRDANTPTVASTPVQRRYELEFTARPVLSDRLEIALGGRVGETRGDLDGWLRWSARLARGVYLRGEASINELHEIDRSPLATGNANTHEYRFSGGLEISFGSIGVASYVSGAVDSSDNGSFRGGTLVARVSAPGIPSVLGERDRIERIELKGSLNDDAILSLGATMRGLETNDSVKGVLLQFDSMATGWANLQELRDRVLGLRKAGKKVYAYLVAGGTGDYYLASAADKVFVDPAGGIRLVGLGGSSIYYKEFFEKLGVRAQFEKIEEFKSAPEAWTRSGPSEPAWRMRNELYDSLYAQVVAGIAEGRGLTTEQVRKLIDGGPYTSGDLDKLKTLVDAVGLPDEISKKITSDMGRAYSVSAAPKRRDERWALPKIAVINIIGDIVGGESRSIPVLGRKLVGGDTIAKALAAARGDSSIKAIVLRINSPGGSALASEIMAREVFKTRGVKPIICSMGNMAASGGYFAAAGCDVIFAEPMTITGSIGIFNGKFDLSKLLDKLGLKTSTLKRGSAADMESFFRPYTDAERTLMKSKLHYYYGRFTESVAKGRKMTQKEVDKIGRGRVWTGAQAKRIGLVDELGGVLDAIQMAKERGGIAPGEKAEMVILPKAKSSLVTKVLGQFSAEPSTELTILDFAGIGDLLRAMPGSLWAEPNAPQARLPFSIVWH